MDAHFWKHERKGCAMVAYFWHSASLGAGTTPCQLTWAHLQHHDWLKGEKCSRLSQREAKAGSQGWQLPVPGCGCQGSYLVCMFGKRLCAGHHAGSPFIQLAQLLSPLVQGNACPCQVPNDPACSSSHTFDPTRSRDVLGEAARGFSCCGLANCRGEMDRQTGMSSWPGSVSAPQPWAAALQQGCHSMATQHMWKALLCHHHIGSAVMWPPLSWSKEAAKVKELWNDRQGPSPSSTGSTFSFHQSSKSRVLLHS